MQIVRKKLSADEIQPAGTRYNEECDCVQVTPDAGTTWNDAPGLDPRSQPGYALPLLSSDDPRCDAAANMVQAVRHFVDTMENAATAQGVATLILEVFGAFLPLGLIVALVVIIASAIVTIGIALLKAAMTDEQYDILLCAFYCNLQADGSMTADNYAALYPYVEENMEATAAGFCERIFDLLGYVGLQNAGASGAETGDCSDCVDCLGTCFSWVAAGFTKPFSDAPGMSQIYEGTAGYGSDCAAGIPTLNCAGNYNLNNTPAVIFKVELDINFNDTATDVSLYMTNDNSFPPGVPQTFIATQNVTLTGTHTLTFDVSPSAYYGIQVICVGSSCTVDAEIQLVDARLYSDDWSVAALAANCGD